MNVVQQRMADFLSTVTSQPKNPDFMEEVLKTFEKNDVESEQDLVGMKIDMMTHMPSGAKASFIYKAIDLANANATHHLLPVASASSDPMQTLMKALKKDNPKVHVNVAERLKETSLDSLPQTCWPPGVVTDALATEASQLQKLGVVKPFVFVDLRKYVPAWCADVQTGAQDFLEHRAHDADGDSMLQLAKVLENRNEATKPKRLLSIFQWGIAFDRYAVAAAAANQMPFVTALMHKDVCLHVAANGKRKRRLWLALCYDEVARRSWYERAFANDETLDIAQEAMQINDAFVSSAEAMYDTLDMSHGNDAQGQQHFGNNRFHKGSAKGGHKGENKNAGACFNCGEMGHRMSDCPKGASKGGKKRRY